MPKRKKEKVGNYSRIKRLKKYNKTQHMKFDWLFVQETKNKLKRHLRDNWGGLNINRIFKCFFLEVIVDYGNIGNGSLLGTYSSGCRNQKLETIQMFTKEQINFTILTQWNIKQQ